MSGFSFKNKTFGALLVGVWVAVFLVRVLLLARFSNSPDFVPNGDDMKFYADWGARIAGGQWTDGKAFYGLPGYAYALSLLGENAEVRSFMAGLLQCVFEAFTAVFLVRIGRGAFREVAGESAAVAIGLGAALGWMCFQPAQAFSIILMPTSWVICAFWGLVLWIMESGRTGTWRTWLGMGLLAGFVSMFVATILLLLPLVVAAIVLRDRTGQALPAKIGGMAGSVALMFAGVFAGCSPAWLHNYLVAGEPVLLSAHSGLNFYIGNNPIATGYPKIPAGLSASQEGLLRDSITLAEKETGRSMKRWEVSEHWAAKAEKWRSENREAWLRLMGTKLSNFWNAFQYDDVSIISRMRSQEVLPPGLKFGMVAAFALPGLVLGAAAARRSRWAAAAVLLHMCSLLPVFVTERYRLCAVPGLLLFGCFLLWRVWDWAAGLRWAPVAAAAALTLLCATFVSTARGDYGLWSLDPYNTGIRNLQNAEKHRRAKEPEREKRMLEAARTELELAFAYVQDNSEINFALGNYWLGVNDFTKAKTYYRRTLELAPTHADCLNNVGYIAMQEKNWPVAVRFFEIALRHQPEDFKTRYLLAKAHEGAGNLGAAKKAVDDALRLAPGRPEFQALKAKFEKMPLVSPSPAPAPAPQAP